MIAPPDEQQLRILILEDRPTDAELVSSELRRGRPDASTEVVRTREEFHRAIETDPDVIISDFNLPGFGAPEALRAVQESGSDAPFIIVSGSIGEDRAVEMIKAGAADYLLKDRLTRLPQAVNQAMAARTLRRRQRETERALRATVEAALDCIITVDENDTIVEFNPAAEQVFHWSRSVAIGRQMSDLIVPAELRTGHRSAMLNLMEHGDAGLLGRRVEITAMRADGSEFPVEWSVVRLGSEGPALFTVFIRDITERKGARLKLQAQEEEYRLLFESNPNPMMVFDPATLQILAVNSRAEQQYGYAREEFLALNLLDLHPPDEAQRLREAVATTGLHGRYSATHRHLKKDGSTMLIDVSSDPITFAGSPARLAATIDVTERVHAEQALRRSEREHRELAAKLETERARLVTAQSVAKVGDWHVDFVTGARTWSAETCRIFGADPECPNVSNERFMQIVHPDDRAAVTAASRASLREGLAASLSHRLRLADGTVKWIEQHWQVIRDPAGQPLRATGTVQDITQRAEAEAVLRRSEMNLAFAQRLSHTGSWEILLDPDVPELERDLHWSDEEFRIFGFEPGAVEAKQRLFYQLTHPDDRERIAAKFATAFASGTPYDDEHRIIRPDGTERVLYEQATFSRDGEAIAKVVGVTQDITERKQAEARIREQASLIDLAHDAIIVRDMDNRVELWNDGAQRLYGWTAKEVRGRRAAEFLYADAAPMQAAWAMLLREGSWQGELEHVRNDGSTVVVRSHWTLLKDDAGEPKSILSINTDITEQKHLQQQLLRAQRLESIGTLASGVAHDLNNILAPILMAVPMLRSGCDHADKHEMFLNAIEQSAERGAGIVRQVLTFARGADGERVLIQPAYLLKEVSQIIGETFPKTITLRTNYHDDLFMIEGDATQLHQVLLNLCVNARDAMPHGGTLNLSAENFDVDDHYSAMTPGTHPGPHVLINVADSGAGIPAQIMSKIFDPFFTTKAQSGRTGLGLSTVLGIVRSHSGMVSAYSTESGTIFRVLLPASADAAVVHDRTGAAALPLGNGETLLIVDDELPIRQVAESLLVARGYKVLLAEDGPEALAIFSRRRREIALVLTDQMMPMMSGLTLARTIRKMDPAAKLVISTSREEDSSPAELRAIGIEAVLTKPYTQRTLLGTLSRVLHSEGTSE